MQKLLITILWLAACVGFTPAHAQNAASMAGLASPAAQPAVTPANQAPVAAPRAFLDSIDVNPHDRTITVAGWAVSGQDTGGKLGVVVYVGEEAITAQQVQRYARPDVVSAAQRPDWLNSGFRATIPIPASLDRGLRGLHVKVRFEHGGELDCIPSVPSLTSVTVRADMGRYLGTRLVLLGCLAMLVLCFAFASRISRGLSAWTSRTVAPAAPLALALVAVFVAFVALGVSGTALGLSDEDLPVVGVQTTTLAGHARLERSDEYRVATPISIGQARHVPPFPVVNHNLGPDGLNMLIPGMTGVPVLGVQALGRPATWGYFVLPLPQAMAWQWWFPVFGCVLALWGCFALLFRRQWRLSFCLALCFVISPYAVAWSYWPAYVTMFAALAFSAFVVLLQARICWLKPVLAAALGMAAAGFVLTLYPPWQVPLAYLFVLLLAGVLVRDWNSLDLSWRNLLWLAAGLALAGVIVGCWWLDARDAVAKMLATVYPGQRQAVPGGTMTSWYLARGFTNFATMYSYIKTDPNPGEVLNPCEVASFAYLTLPAICGALFNWKQLRRNWPVFAALIVFLAMATYYQFVGIPVGLAKLSLWGRTIPVRVDIASGLAALALIGTAFARDPRVPVEDYSLRARQVAAIVVALAWTMAIWLSVKAAPVVIRELLSPTAIAGALAVVAWCSYLLAARFAVAFFVSLLAFLTFSSAGFNPWVVVSSPATPATPASATATATATATSAVRNCTDDGGRTLVIGSNVPAMTMMASGCPVLNGVSYYPQMKLWDALDPKKQNVFSYNRYQHLFFKLADLQGSADPVITVPQGDVISVSVDARSFDFSRLPIEYVTVKSEEAMNLSLNRTVKPAPTLVQDWLRFKVVR